MSVPRVIVRCPVVFCDTCKSQVLLSDGIGRSTMPTFLIVGTRRLVCVFCAQKTEHPETLSPLRESDAAWFNGAAVLSEKEFFELLISLGGTVIARPTTL